MEVLEKSLTHCYFVPHRYLTDCLTCAMARPSAVETRQIVPSVRNRTPILQSSSPQPNHHADRRTSGVPELVGLTVVRRPVPGRLQPL